MNANELADDLDNMLKAVGLTDNRVPTMLRQQHERLKHLEKMVVWYNDITMTGTHSEEYENGFWEAVDFVKGKQIND